MSSANASEHKSEQSPSAKTSSSHQAEPAQVQQAAANLTHAKFQHEAVKKKIITVAKELIKIAADELGITAGIYCLTKATSTAIIFWR